MIPQNNICRFHLKWRKNLELKVEKIWEYSDVLQYYLNKGCDDYWVYLLINEMIDTLSAIDDGSYWEVKKD
jgi:hypothetical protein